MSLNNNEGGTEGLVIDPSVGTVNINGELKTDVVVDEPKITDDIVVDEPKITDDKPKGFDFNNTTFGEAEAINFDDFADLVELGVNTESDNFRGDVNELVNNGFTKEQISYLYSDFGKNEAPTSESVQKNLSENLTTEQKRDYRPIGRMLLDSLPEAQHGLANKVMSDPSAISILHAVYKKYVVGGSKVNSITQTSQETVGVTFDEAMTEYKDYIDENTSNGKRIDREKLNNLKKDLLSRVDDKDKLGMYFN